MNGEEQLEDHEIFGNNESVAKPRINFLLVFLTISILSTISVFLVLTKSRYELVMNRPSSQLSLLLEDVCFNGFLSISRKNALKEFVTSEYKEILENIKYGPVDISVSPEDFRFISKRDKASCKIIVRSKSGGPRGLRAFIIGTKQNPNYEFNHKVNEISEILLTESDISEGER